MPEVLEKTQSKTFPRVRAEVYYPHEGREEIFYPEQREDDMGETNFHYNLIFNLMQMLKEFLRANKDIFLAANMNLYYEESDSNKWIAPDILISFGIPDYERRTYRLWEEKFFPQIIFEVASDKTWKNDISEKLELYGELGAEEYYVLDSENKYLPAPMMAFHRQGERLLTAPANDERIFSPRLGLEIIRAENTFRLFNPQTNEFLLTLEESEEKRRKTESEIERLKAEIERLKTQK